MRTPSMMWLTPATCLPVLLLLAACTATPPPLYDGLGSSGHVVATDSELAQQYFDQGLALCWGFNHDEALRAFQEVERLDPDCAMAVWGMAFTLGPNINRRLTGPKRAVRAHGEAQRALAMAGKASEVERALIEAQALRFTDPPPEDRSELNLAYANAMREVWARFPDDPMVGTLFADSLMCISRDWRAWGTDEERGEFTPEIVATLEQVLALDIDHAGANHFYIHAVESSNRADRALPSADRLGALMPAAGHMVHMPSHIYVRLGMYDEAVEANARAVERDDEFFAQAPRQGIYHLYRAHNHHFLAWTAMFRGSREDSMAAARAMEAKLPTSSAAARVPGLESYLFVPMHVMMRFGEWENMLAEPAPLERYPIATALWHHGRAVAYANTDRLADARAEAQQFESAVATIPDTETVRRGQTENLMEAARQMMMGEILFKEGDHEAAFVALRKGIQAEDALPYAEPPGWMQPIRHSLGALLLEDGQVAEAEAVYRADLDRHAANVWSLHGLAECLRLTGRDTEARAVTASFEKVGEHADVEITASCFCRTVVED